jgi:Fur family transcriptional regulator, peroxide stress response regulator
MKKTRNTRQRGIILDILQETEDHLTAEMIYRDARRVIPNISLGTVYRNLNFLRTQGLIREIRPGDGGSSRFDGVQTPHAHFHCSACGTLLNIPLPTALERIEFQEAEGISRIASVELHISGMCMDCASQDRGVTH